MRTRIAHSRRMLVTLVAAASIVVAGLATAGVATASPSTVTPVSDARTPAWTDGRTVTVQYAQDFFCDTSVGSGAGTGCEVGQAAARGPVANADRSTLYVLVPLFANPDPAPMCAVASCPNHPMTIDLSRIAGALGGAPDQLASVALPGHSHILDGPAGGWWAVKVVAVTNQHAWAQLAAGRSDAVMDALIATPGSGVLGPIPTNLYLFFNVVGH